MVSKFAGDTKISSIVDNQGDYQEIQWDLDQLGKQTEANGVYSGKYMELHIGTSNQGRTFTVNGRDMESVVKQKDLGVSYSSITGGQCE